MRPSWWWNVGKDNRLCFAGGGGSDASLFEGDLRGFMEWEGEVVALMGTLSFAIVQKYIFKDKTSTNGLLRATNRAMSC